MEIEVEFVDELYRVDPPRSLTFGRSADVVIDEANPFLHRVVGSMQHHGDQWWLRNEGRRTELTLVTVDGKRVVLPPGATQALSSAGGVIRFEAGAFNYELSWSADSSVELPERVQVDASATATQEFGVIPLNTEQRQLLTELCEPRLRDPAATELPANAEVAHRLGWSVKKFDRKLDYLCRRLSRAGVPGLVGMKGGEATDRRANLVAHVIAVGLIGGEDLTSLDERGADGGTDE